MLKDDILIAQQIISGFHNNNYTYHENSFIYKFTNELISSYQHHLKNKENVLSITSSGDHILNCILGGSTNITSYDISRFPKYFFELKKAAILSLTKDEFLDFFTNETNYDKILNYKLFERILNNLNNDSKIFWNNLFNFFDGGEIYLSSLFSRELITPKIVIERNKYLQDNNYKILQKKLEKVNINHLTGNIKELGKSLNDSFDLVLLSSIFYYSFHKINEYETFLNNLKLNNNGIAITYLYNLKQELINKFNDEKYSFEQLKNSKDGIMIYKKSRV